MFVRRSRSGWSQFLLVGSPSDHYGIARLRRSHAACHRPVCYVTPPCHQIGKLSGSAGWNLETLPQTVREEFRKGFEQHGVFDASVGTNVDLEPPCRKFPPISLSCKALFQRQLAREEVMDTARIYARSVSPHSRQGRIGQVFPKIMLHVVFRGFPKG